MSDSPKERSPDLFYLRGTKESTYRALLSEKALSVLEEIARDEQYPGSSDPTTLSLLTTLIHTCRMTRVLQIGTWIGFSTVVIAGALARVEAESKPTLLTVDPAIPELEKAKRYASRAGLEGHVRFLTGSSLDPMVQQLVREFGPYDLVFIDSQHDYDIASVELRTFWPTVKEGGILVAHDASKTAAEYDTKQQGGVMRAITEWIAAERIEQSLFLTLPLWNPMGLFIAFKIPPAEAPSGNFVVYKDTPLETSAETPVHSNVSDQLSVLQINAMAFSEHYRVHNVSEQLELAGIPFKVLNLPDLYADPDKAARLFGEALIIVFHRVAYDSLMEKLAAQAHRHGTILVYETDDLIFSPGLDSRWVDGLRYLSPAEVSLYYEGVDRYERMMQLCDVGLFSTSFLASLAERKGMRSWVLRNALGKPFLDAAERAYQRRTSRNGAPEIRLGYSSGTKTHDRDFAQFAPALIRLMDKDSRVVLAIFGHLQISPEFSRFESRIEYYAPVPLEKVPEILSSFDVNLAPLELFNPFCRAKSELKYIEAGILGIPTVASRTEEFGYAIESGKNGFLVSDDQELEDCLARLTGDEKLREAVGRSARQDVLTRYTSGSRTKELVQILEEIRKGSPHS